MSQKYISTISFLLIVLFMKGCDNDPYCPDGTSWCWAKCVDLNSDERNCGRCDEVCGDGDGCISGECVSDVECTEDFDCDDGQWCNGQEVCNAGSCEHGTQVNCDDGASCTVDLCDEDNDICVNVPDNARCNLCDDGGFCGIGCVCDPELLGNPYPPCVSCPADSGCVNLSLDCDDGDPCTLDLCNEEDDVCEHVLQPIPGAEGPVGDVTCSDGIDNDCDMLTDILDPDCCGCSQDADCDDMNVCTRDYCTDCMCWQELEPDGTPCGSDGESCMDGVCQESPCLGEIQALSDEIYSVSQGCTAVVRIERETREIIAFHLECGPYCETGETCNTADLCECTEEGCPQVFNDHWLDDEYLYLLEGGEFCGCVAAVSKRTRLLDFMVGEPGFYGCPWIFHPTEWRSASELGTDCQSTANIPRIAGYIGNYGNVLPADEVAEAIDIVMNTAIPDAFMTGGQIRSAIVLLHYYEMCGNCPAEWIVLVIGGS